MKTSLLISLVIMLGYAANAIADPALMLSQEETNESGSKVGSISHNHQLSKGLERDFSGLNKKFAIEFLADKQEVAAVTFEIPVDSGAEVNLRNCISNVPKTHTAVCERNKDVIRVAVFSITNAPLRTATLGTIEVKNNHSPLTIKKASLAGPKGNAVAVDAL